MSHLVLIAPSDTTKVLTDDPANAGYDAPQVRQLLERAAAGGNSFEVLDSDGLTEESREGQYFAAGVRAAALRIRLSDHFERPEVAGASGFGREVPSLLVYDKKGGTLVDVYPHSRRAGLLYTIADFLTGQAS